jgi:hypothetical protein
MSLRGVLDVYYPLLLLYSFRGFFVYFPFLYMHIFGPPVLRLIQVLFRAVIIIAVIRGFNPLRVTLPPLLTALGVFPSTLDGDAR